MSLQENQVYLCQKLYQNDLQQRIKSQENSSSHDSEGSPQNSCQQVSYDLSPSYSTSPQGCFSEAVKQHERSTACSSEKSLRRSSECNFRRWESEKTLKTMQEVKLFIPRKNLSQNQSEEEDSDDTIDELSCLSESKNSPIASPRTKKHPNQKVSWETLSVHILYFSVLNCIYS